MDLQLNKVEMQAGMDARKALVQHLKHAMLEHMAFGINLHT